MTKVYLYSEKVYSLGSHISWKAWMRKTNGMLKPLQGVFGGDVSRKALWLVRNCMCGSHSEISGQLGQGFEQFCHFWWLVGRRAVFPGARETSACLPSLRQCRTQRPATFSSPVYMVIWRKVCEQNKSSQEPVWKGPWEWMVRLRFWNHHFYSIKIVWTSDFVYDFTFVSGIGCCRMVRKQSWVQLPVSCL